MNARQGNIAREFEVEIQRLINYVNDRVVPEVRRSSSHVLRLAAEQFSHLAEHLDRGGRRVVNPATAASASNVDPAH